MTVYDLVLHRALKMLEQPFVCEKTGDMTHYRIIFRTPEIGVIHLFLLNRNHGVVNIGTPLALCVPEEQKKAAEQKLDELKRICRPVDFFLSQDDDAWASYDFRLNLDLSDELVYRIAGQIRAFAVLAGRCGTQIQQLLERADE